MPLMMCPNCNASMTEVKRHEVTFDMCPTCRGVWLDRGELEKIIASAHGEASAPAAAAQAYQQRQPHQPRQEDYRRRDDDDDYYRDDRGRRRKRGGFDLFDIFD